jgi:hypothetical protein
MAHPDFERWTTEETIIGSVAFPELEGTLVTKRTKVLNDVQSADFPGIFPGKREPAESHLLIHGACIYRLDGWDAPCALTSPTECQPAFDHDNHINAGYKREFLRGNVGADFCFPMRKGMTWGKVPGTSPAGEDVWTVGGVNSDPFGASGTRTFHLSAYGGSGESIDQWFAEGVGVLQYMVEHHGTYDEDRRQLLSATIRGKTTRYQLTPARTVPFNPDECGGPGWQHFSRADGLLFKSVADCRNYINALSVN